jgi:clan AA aspartic protease
MTTGSMSDRRPIVPLLVRGPQGQEILVEALLDTGFDGFLTLPPAAITALGLPFLNFFRAGLADGNVVRLQVYSAVCTWDGVECPLEVLATGRDPLLGTSLLDGHEVVLQFVDGGLVTIERL